MRLEQTFVAPKDQQTVLANIATYLENKGYKRREEEIYAPSSLVYERGSKFGSMTGFSPKRWRVVANVQAQPNPAGGTQVTAVFDVNTTGQVVVQRERDFWDKELAGLAWAAEGFSAQIVHATATDPLLLERQLRSGADWFFWIAGLSAINSILALLGGGLNFLAGLGITQLIDGISLVVIEEMVPAGATWIKLTAFLLDLIIAGIFVAFGFLARRHKWAFIVGMVIYALDMLIFLLGPDLLSIGFHLWALFGLYRGLQALGKLQQRASASETETYATAE